MDACLVGSTATPLRKRLSSCFVLSSRSARRNLYKLMDTSDVKKKCGEEYGSQTLARRRRRATIMGALVSALIARHSRNEHGTQTMDSTTSI